MKRSVARQTEASRFSRVFTQCVYGSKQSRYYYRGNGAIKSPSYGAAEPDSEERVPVSDNHRIAVIGLLLAKSIPSSCTLGRGQSLNAT
ncbi:MAG: hypothetical protein WB543_03630 [Candidatus Acidiferrum sp.]